MSQTRIEDHLYAGESVWEAFDVGRTRVVVTSHRVAVVTPDSGGVEQTERPNVTAVEQAVRGSRGSLWTGFLLFVTGIPLVALGYVLRDSGIGDTPEVEEEGAEAIGVGGIGWIEDLLVFAANLDLVFMGSGVALLVFGVFLGFVYWFFVREPTLAIRLAGGQSDIHMPRANVSAEAEQRLERAIMGDGPGPDGAIASGPAAGDTTESLPDSETEVLPPGEAKALSADAIAALPGETVENLGTEESDGSDAVGEDGDEFGFDSDDDAFGSEESASEFGSDDETDDTWL
jgi:hypothetical protein